MNTMTLRPHEVLIEIIDRIDGLPTNVLAEVVSGNPKGFACSAALRHLRGIMLSLDKLDSKYDDSLGIMDPSRVAAGEGLDLGGEEELRENTENDDDDVEEGEDVDAGFRSFLQPHPLLIKSYRQTLGSRTK